MFLLSAKRKGQPAEVPTLLTLCHKVLVRHLDKLHDVGDTSLSLLHPLLRHATAEQLSTIEACNPRRDLETNEFWKVLSEREFGKATPEEFKKMGRGSWKAYYNAKVKELEDRKRQLSKRLQTISQSQEDAKQARSARVLEKPIPQPKKRKEAPEPAKPPAAVKGASLMAQARKDFQLTRNLHRPRGHPS